MAGKTILVVDDEVDLREILADEFRMAGARVLEAANGKAALEQLQTTLVDAVLSDIRMPGGDGVQLLHDVKALNPYAPPMILITGFSDLLPEDAYDRGAAGIFPKPCDLKSLVRALVHVLKLPAERWGGEPAAQNSDLQMEASFGSVTVGSGGLFIPASHELPAPGHRVYFELDQDGRALRGTGVCRFKQEGTNPSEKRGVGLEFLELDPELRQLVMAHLTSNAVRSFIPKGRVLP